MNYFSRSGLAALLAVSSLMTAEVQAVDWPQWRGPNRDGVWNETGIVQSFPGDQPARLLEPTSPYGARKSAWTRRPTRTAMSLPAVKPNSSPPHWRPSREGQAKNHV